MKVLIVFAMLLLTVAQGATKKLPNRVDEIYEFHTEKLDVLSFEDICVSYHQFRDEKKKLEMGRKPNRREHWYILTPEALTQLEGILMEKGITEEEMDMIRAEQIGIGMSIPALIASWGKANKENKSTSASGTRIQHIYTRKGTYVYTRNGLVTSWQQ